MCLFGEKKTYRMCERCKSSFRSVFVSNYIQYCTIQGEILVGRSLFSTNIYKTTTDKNLLQIFGLPSICYEKSNCLCVYCHILFCESMNTLLLC